ncbi:39S ribosomal protein L22, mitochondrial-like [Portunus trituberculatus]|uniref:39S ribosomal protein L22, mitochondrial-like n=1 Tax=Portunus trituberculatus TaxID=210409 RepID=UPI001E1D0DDD|nr:39S ribosomal protein L22, mitochondrial-like [Portunus trituberculatus]
MGGQITKTQPLSPLLAPQAPLLAPSAPPPGQPLHTTGAIQKNAKMRWEYLNTKIYKPTPTGEEERPAFVCHVKKNIKYSPEKMWYIACLVRGLKVDDALAQLQFVSQKGAVHVREALEEAKELAVKDHYVEFPSHLWVSESFVGRGIVYRGFRRHARRRFGKVEYRHCHYFLTLEEGTPPQQYYSYKARPAPEEMLKDYLENLRRRNVPYAI